MLLLAAILLAAGLLVYALDRGGAVYFLSGWTSAPPSTGFPGPLGNHLPTFLHTLAFILMVSIRRLILNTDNPFRSAKTWGPAYVFLVGFIISLVTLFKGLKHLDLEMSIPMSFLVAIGIGLLLSQGIGDTLRVSLTRDPVEEIRVGYEILRALGIRQRGPEIISCPTCGRTDVDLIPIVREIEEKLAHIDFKITVAIMGCVVNGPGEAKEADIGIACGKKSAVLFKKGKIIKKIDEKNIVNEMVQQVLDWN